MLYQDLYAVHRLRPNYLLLPANAPKCAHNNNHHEVNYFPSHFDPCHPLGGRREEVMIEKENNFAQPGATFRSGPGDRQERFIARVLDALSDPRVTHEIRSIWLSYWSQADRMLGQKIATKFNVKANM
ncbi:catalase-1/2 isoform X2 [Selaginella moellendorffii]|uniref:catalase-1/2 isoform X2 n=1 Tax=Selaginella moellendorffii TaxID=88036 RepID=UPI000D1C94EA|nr:catalase-1/2 isoform X2 [Selaginella moellendorffii]|eukprot:XP_024541127.1 catalase-1/2 isoform X2 [Selaginella moellendorffii]